MGAIAERIRTWPAATRSPHPQTSFSAVGAAAARVTAVHDLNCQLGERSPLGTLHDLDAKVLLLGVGYDRCTMFHLAEYQVARLRPAVTRTFYCVVTGPAGRQWVSYDDISLDSGPFAELGADFEEAMPVRVGPAGAATARLFRARDAVSFATRWLVGRGPAQPGSFAEAGDGEVGSGALDDDAFDDDAFDDDALDDDAGDGSDVAAGDVPAG
jgi:aminoglycoside 3-N-acetyltransferase